ncbi:unnamed protein product [Discula destructiva]
MMLYRPFLHYISPRTATGKTVDERYYACAAAGISVSRNIIHIAMEIKNQALVVGPFWSMLYTEFFAILTLVFYVLESPDKHGSAEIYADAKAGREMIAKLAGRSFAADRISKSMDTLWENLPESIKNGKARPTTSRKRSAPGLNPVAMPISTKKPAASSTRKGSSAAARLPLNQRTSMEELHRTSTQHTMRLNYNDYHVVDVASNSPDNNAIATPPAAHPSSGAYMRSSSQTQESPSVYKLDALMFPSGDPFAYPDQPLDFGTTVAATHAEPQSSLMSNVHPVHAQQTDSRNYYMPGVYGDIEGQLSESLLHGVRLHPRASRPDQPTVGPLPSYLMQSNHVQNGMGLPAQMYQPPNALAMQHAQAQHQHHQHQQHAHHQRGGREMDDIMADSSFNRTWDMFGGNFKAL